MINLDNRPNEAAAGSSGKYMYPMFRLNTELWITSRFFFDLGGSFSLSRVAGTAQGPAGDSSGVHELRGALGYRIHFFAPDPGPYIHFRLGYASEGYGSNVGANLGFTDLSYSGPLVGLGLGVPVGLKYGLNFDVNALIFSSVSANPDPGGESKASAWDFTVGAYYRITPKMRLDGKLLLFGNGADFTAGPIQYAHQSGQMASLDLSYYF
jgi:hypothetical protein